MGRAFARFDGHGTIGEVCSGVDVEDNVRCCRPRSWPARKNTLAEGSIIVIARSKLSVLFFISAFVLQLPLCQPGV